MKHDTLGVLLSACLILGSAFAGEWHGYNESGYTATANGYTWCYRDLYGGGVEICGYDAGDDMDYDWRNAFSSGTQPSGSVTIPSTLDGKSVVQIGEYAFYNCDNVTSVTMPSSVRSIGYNAFEGCSKLSGITLPSGITAIEGGTFSGCSSLTSITIPSSVTRIGGYAFYGCSGLRNVYGASGLKSIEGMQFALQQRLSCNR